MTLSNVLRSTKLEALIGISLPEDYKQFIDKYGYLCLNNISREVYGYKLEYDINKIPCVIGATNLCKIEYKLDHHQLVISHTGYESNIVILDTISGYVLEQNYSGVRKKIANSFSIWLARLVSENDLASL
jgi:hypothetical protein